MTTKRRFQEHPLNKYFKQSHEIENTRAMCASVTVESTDRNTARSIS